MTNVAAFRTRNQIASDRRVAVATRRALDVLYRIRCEYGADVAAEVVASLLRDEEGAGR